SRVRFLFSFFPLFFLLFFFFFLLSPPPPTSTLFPYTTLFRSRIRILGLLRLLFVLFVLALVVLAGVMLYKTFRYKSRQLQVATADRKSTRLNSSHRTISYAVFCLKKKKNNKIIRIKT